MHGGMSRRQVRRLEEAMADPLVLINTFEVSHEDAERFVAAWGRGGTTLPLSLVRGHRAASGGHAQCRLPVRQHRPLADRRGLPDCHAKPWLPGVSCAPGRVPAASGPCWLVGLEAIGPGLPPARERDHHQVSRSGQRGGCEAGWVLAGWLDMTGAAGLALLRACRCWPRWAVSRCARYPRRR
jgi:hypothetical protein